MKRKAFFGIVCFLTVFCLLFSQVNQLFRRKTLTGIWDHTTKIAGFYNEPENEFDLIYLGSSNTYCSFSPLAVWEKIGVKSYVLATQRQPVWASYYYLRESLKTQRPRVVVMDALMFSKHQEYYDDGVNFSFMDNIPFSKNKIELAFASAPKGERLPLLIPLIKYHSRWNELSEEDYTYDQKSLHDPWKGYVLLDETAENIQKPDVSGIKLHAELAEKELFYFHKIRTLCQENGIQLIFVKTPSNPTETAQAHYNTFDELCREYDIPFWNFNTQYDEIGLDLNTDFYDKSHLNYRGAEKFSNYFAEKISPYFPEQKTDPKWDALYEKYQGYTAGLSNKS